MDKELIWALKTADFEEIKKRLTAEDVNRTLESGRKPLHYAADYGHPELINFLLSMGADINASDKHGLTPLMTACFEDHPSCVKILLEKGADKNHKGPEGITMSEGTTSAEIKDMLK